MPARRAVEGLLHRRARPRERRDEDETAGSGDASELGETGRRNGDVVEHEGGDNGIEHS